MRPVITDNDDDDDDDELAVKKLTYEQKSCML